MLKSSNIGEQRTRIRDPLPQIRWEYKRIILPRRILKPQTRHQSIPESHEQCASAHEWDELAVARHDETCDQPAKGGGEGGDGEAAAGAGRGVQEYYLEEEGEHEEVLLDVSNDDRR
jgi:hypothetical protein